MIIQKNGKWFAKCDACGFESKRPRKGPDDMPKWWGGDPQHYLRCSRCEDEMIDQMSEQEGSWYF